MTWLKWLGIEQIQVSIFEKLISAFGSMIAIYLLFRISGLVLPAGAMFGVVASMGASAVLLFAVPHGPLSQPWPVLGGHGLSAVVGVCCAQFVGDPVLATALAVGLSIGVMYQLRCLHPPGGATAFTAVMGGPAILDLGFGYVLFPIGLNALVMLLLAVLINAPFSWRRYPAILIKRPSGPTLPPHAHVEITSDDHQQFVEALRSLDTFVDVSEDDLIYLSKLLTQKIADRTSLVAGRRVTPP